MVAGDAARRSGRRSGLAGACTRAVGAGTAGAAGRGWRSPRMAASDAARAVYINKRMRKLRTK